MKGISKAISVAVILSIVILLLFGSYVLGEKEVRTWNKSTRGISESCHAMSNDRHCYILPGENATYNVTYQPTLFEGSANVYPQLENVPPYWVATFNETNFTITTSNPYNLTLLVIPPQNVSVGFEGVFTIGGIYKKRDENSEGDEKIHIVYPTQITIKILGPDLWVHFYDPLESNQRPREGQKIDFTAKIRNKGDVNAENVSLRFMVDGKQVGANRTIPLIEADNYVNETFSWVAKKGEHTIRVEVDFDNTIDEYEECGHNSSITMSIDDPFTTFIPCICTSIVIIGFLIIFIFLRKKKKNEDKQVTLDYYAK